jgi:hypothetical protein
MAVRARDFLRAHPVSDPSHLAITTRLDDLVAKAQSLAVLEQGGRLDARAANRHRTSLRVEILTRKVRFIERVGVLAAAERPDLAGRFRGPSFNASNAVFLTRGWDLANLAREHLELLARHGLAATQLEDLASALTRFEEATLKANVGRGTHVGARRELESTVRGILKILGVLDVLNKIRFSGNEQLLGEWLSARNVFGSSRSRRPAPSPDTPPTADGESRTA